MATVRTAGDATRDEALTALRAEGCSAPRHWSNAPGDRYGAHAHDYDKVLYCLQGSITFHTDDGDVMLTAGDRLDIPAGTPHGATVGPEGCACVEATA